MNEDCCDVQDTYKFRPDRYHLREGMRVYSVRYKGVPKSNVI